MIKDIFIQKKILHFKEPFRIAYEEVDKTEVVIIKIKDEKGHYGLGSAAPDFEVTKETVKGVFRVLQEKLNKEFFLWPISQWYRYHEKIQEVFRDFPSAQNAVEEAILNLWSQNYKISLSHFFGGYCEQVETMITIGIKSTEEAVGEVKQRLKEGFKIIKLKCGLDLREDIERIKAVIKVIPSSSQLILDANQGYSLPEAKKLLLVIKNLGISLIEQPIKAENLKGLKELHALKLVPIIADESVVTVQDAYNLLLGDYVDGVNIKIMKCGGPINFLKIFHLAKSLHKIIMIGCMYESNISITTGALLALALPIDYVDLDSGPLDFYDDPTKGGASIKNGKLVIKKPLTLNE
ncbi:dipeptide epimerase [Candidatus Microgenomates bacterium]|nr:dipeptide epimerase [Candidatus Microgenomates bacterium]